MAYSITPSADGRYILLKVTGEITRKSSLMQIAEAHARGRELGTNRYLVDLTEARNIETITENYEFAYQDMQNSPAIDRLACVAVLVSPDDHSHDFPELVSQNAGLNVSLFRDEEEAVNHLLGQRS